MLAKLLLYLIQWTWGLPQNLAGLILSAFHLGKPHFSYKSTLVRNWGKPKGLSLGMFIFIWEGAPERMVAHEYGHSIQSMILGPFYMFVIGIPSLIWCNVPRAGKKWRTGKREYFSFFSEKWADELGKVKHIRKSEMVCEHDTREC